MDVARFRSFVERYVIERASTFRVDHEDEDMWNAVLNAKACYKKIAQHGIAEKDYDDMGVMSESADTRQGRRAALGQALMSHKPGTP